MASGDIRIIDVGGHINVPVRTFPTISGSTAINPGEPVEIAIRSKGGLDNYVIVVTDGRPSTGTAYFVGIAQSAGTHTASADGYVDVLLDLPGVVYAAKAKTTTTFNTQKLVDNQTFYRIVLDLTSSTYTADVTTTAATAGFTIWGGDYSTYTVYFVANDGATWRAMGDDKN